MKIYKLITILIFIVAPQSIFAADTKAQLKEFWKLSPMALSAVTNGEIVVDADVNDHKDGKEQSFELRAMGMHKKNCKRVLAVLSQYEMYDDWIDFIKKSKYEVKRKLWTVKADHTLLPFPMLVHIFIDRMEKPGEYPFVFPTGMFKGLKGTAYAKDINNRCMIYMKSNWYGKHSKIPNFVVDIFSETLSVMGARVLLKLIK